MLFNVFDCETTGLPFHPEAPLGQQPRIIEFAGIVTDGENIIDSIEFICSPGIEIEQIITDITGLTNEDLRDRPPFKTFVNDVAVYFAKGVGRIAHNLAFDRAMLDFDLRRIGQTLENINYHPGVEICTVEQTQFFYGKPKKLNDLYNEWCQSYTQKHRALDDVIRLHEFCKAFGIYEAFKESK